MVGCQPTVKVSNPPSPLGIPVTFCIDLLGKEEPIFTKPLLLVLSRLEQEDFIQLTIKECSTKSDYIDTLSRSASNQSIVLTGPLMAEEVEVVAKEYPDSHFLVLDFPLYHNNISSIAFLEEAMACRAIQVGRNQSVSKKIGALFPGAVEDPLSVWLKKACQPHLVEFVPIDSSSQVALAILAKWRKEGVDFIYIARSSHLETIILSESSRNEGDRFRIICPKLNLPTEKQKAVVAYLEKNYEPLLRKLLPILKQPKKQGQLYWSTDFSLVLTR